MSLIYALIARKSTILAEHSLSTGNFAQITQVILDKIPANQPTKLTYVYDNYLFHYIVDERGLVYLCMADDAFGRRIPFAFLEEVRNDFQLAYGESALVAGAYGMDVYSATLGDKMQFYNSNPESDRLRYVQGEISQVRDVMVQNIEKVLERGERIDILVDKTDNLNQAAFQFKKRSTALKRQMWWKNTKITILLAVVCVIILYLLIGAGCGLPGWSKCVGGGN
eukprot:Partr_v1_DN28853_c1_g2_i2_m33267 putative Vesicle-associated membrane protein